MHLHILTNHQSGFHGYKMTAKSRTDPLKIVLRVVQGVILLHGRALRRGTTNRADGHRLQPQSRVPWAPVHLRILVGDGSSLRHVRVLELKRIFILKKSNSL